MLIVIPSTDGNGDCDNYIVEAPEGLHIYDALKEAKGLVKAAAENLAKGEEDCMISAMDRLFSDAGYGHPSWAGVDLDWRDAESEAEAKYAAGQEAAA